jgi:hypothetical protein
LKRIIFAELRYASGQAFFDNIKINILLLTVVLLSAAFLLRGLYLKPLFDSASWYGCVLASNDSLLHEIFDSRRLIVSGILRRMDGGC